jgi:hypothetical protein
MCSNWLLKKYIISSFFSLWIFGVKIFSNFQNKWCTFDRKRKGLGKKKDCALLRFECFDHIKTFLICVKFWTYKLLFNERYFKKTYANSNYYASVVIFQTYKIVVLRNVHSLLQGLFLLCFCPKRCQCWLCLHICTLINSYLNHLKMINYVF